MTAIEFVKSYLHKKIKNSTFDFNQMLNCLHITSPKDFWDDFEANENDFYGILIQDFLDMDIIAKYQYQSINIFVYSFDGVLIMLSCSDWQFVGGFYKNTEYDYAKQETIMVPQIKYVKL